MFSKVFLISILAALLSALVGCSHSGPPLKVGAHLWPGYAIYFWAEEQELINKDLVKLVEYQNATHVSNALLNDELDAAMLTLDEALRLQEAGLDLTVVQVIDLSKGGDAVIARELIDKNTNFADKVVAVDVSAVGALMLEAFKQHYKIPDDVLTVNQISAEAAVSAFEKGVDFIVTHDPFRHHLLNIGGVSVFDTSLKPDLIMDVLVIRNKRIEGNKPDQIEHLIEGFFKALEFMESDSSHAVSYIQKRLKLTQQQVKRSLDVVEPVNLAHNRGLLSGQHAGLKYVIRSTEDILLKVNLINSRVDVETFISSEYLPGL